jgi:hypothetical protein
MCITMAIAAGKSAGKAPRMVDKAFKPPTDAAMAMTGNVWRPNTTGNSGRAPLARFFGRRADADIAFMGLGK